MGKSSSKYGSLNPKIYGDDENVTIEILDNFDSYDYKDYLINKHKCTIIRNKKVLLKCTVKFYQSFRIRTINDRIYLDNMYCPHIKVHQSIKYLILNNVLFDNIKKSDNLYILNLE